MEDKAKKLLDKELANLAREITDPKIVAGYISALTDTDKDKINSEFRERGQTYGVHELVSKLKKRGPKAFPQFVSALHKEDLHDTASRLSQGINANATLPVRETVETASTDRKSTDGVVARGPISTTSSTVLVHQCSEESESSQNTITDGVPSTIVDNASSHDIHTPLATDRKCKNDTLLKDIQSQLKTKIVKALSVEDSLMNDWRGLAGEAGLTVDQEQELRSSKDQPMEALFSKMVQKKYSISDLINMLHKLQRNDIISTIGEYGYNVNPSDETNVDHPAQGQCPLSPSQASESDSKDNKDAHRMSMEESKPNDQDELSATPLSDIPEDVFLPACIHGKALVLGVESYQNMPQLRSLNKTLNSLVYILESDFKRWEVHTNVRSKKCSSSMMEDTVENYLVNVKKNDVCFIYFAGHTMQINGENYLLSTEVDISSNAADIMDCSLNINQFMKELNQLEPLMIMLFIDGSRYHEVQCDIDGFVPGLVAMVPPSNGVIVYSNKPGLTTPREDPLSFVHSMIKIFEEKVESEKKLSLTTLLSELKERCPSSFVVSLSPRSILPLYICAAQEGPEIQHPNDNTPRVALIFYEDMEKEGLKDHITNDVDHLKTILEKLDWKVEIFAHSAYHNVKDTLRQRILKHGDNNQMKIAMVYFIGFQAKDQYSLDIVQDDPSISVKWVINIMSEYIRGPKAVIVDDSSLHVQQTLSLIAPLPADVLMCVPTVKKPDKRASLRDSFTLLLAQNLGTNRERKLKRTLEDTARRYGTQLVYSNLFFA